MSRIHALLFPRQAATLDQLESDNYALQKEVDKLRQNMAKCLEICESENLKILGIESISFSEYFVVERTYPNAGTERFDIGLISTCSSRCHYFEAEIRGTVHILETGGNLEICDLITSAPNMGLGSIAMKYFLKRAKKCDVNFIWGDLSPVDKDHFDRSEHFYKKHGFTVKFNDDRTIGRIRLQIQEGS